MPPTATPPRTVAVFVVCLVLIILAQTDSMEFLDTKWLPSTSTVGRRPAASNDDQSPSSSSSSTSESEATKEDWTDPILLRKEAEDDDDAEVEKEEEQILREEKEKFDEDDEGVGGGDSGEVKVDKEVDNSVSLMARTQSKKKGGKRTISTLGNGKENDEENEFKPFRETSLAMRVLEYKQGLPKMESFSQGNWPRNDEMDLESRGIPKASGIHVVTTFFHGSYHERRFKELLATLVSNLENPYIDALHVLWQGADPRLFVPEEIAAELAAKGLSRKLVLTPVKKQPTYKELFTYVNLRLATGAAAIVTNADIYFDATLKCVRGPPPKLAQQLEGSKSGKPAASKRRAIALTRRRSPLCGNKPDHINVRDLCLSYMGSHDAFMVSPPVEKSVVMRTAHTQNQGYGAENIVIYELRSAGYRVINPCYLITAFHLHCSPERHYSKVIINRDPPRPGSVAPISTFKCGPLTVF